MKISQMLLISDMDGTLLTDQKTISPGNLEAIKAFQAAGGRFTIATGRSIISAAKYVGLLHQNGVLLDGPAILFNGAAIYDYHRREMLWHTVMPPDTLRYLAVVKERYPQVGIEVLGEKTTFVATFNRFVKEHLEIEHLPYQIAELDEIPPGAIKVLFALEHELIPEFARFMEEQRFAGVCYVESAEHYYEMLPAGNSKGEALSHLSALTGIPVENTVTVGDYNNDIEMIRRAGIGVAMGNALPAVKQAADRVVASNNEDGLKQLIEGLLQENS